MLVNDSGSEYTRNERISLSLTRVRFVAALLFEVVLRPDFTGAAFLVTVVVLRTGAFLGAVFLVDAILYPLPKSSGLQFLS